MPPKLKKNKNLSYTEDKLLEAIARIKNKELSYQQASRLYNIPGSTLFDKVTGKTPPTLMKRGNYIICYFKFYLGINIFLNIIN